MAVLRKRGFQVQPYKVGPDYIDPAFHTFVTGNKSRNLDSWMLEEEIVKKLFVRNFQGKDIAVIEGVMGLYDGSGSRKDVGSTAHISKIIKAPVILIINGSGMAASAAAQVLGYKMYDPDVMIAGVIINNVSGEKHYQILKEAIERDIKIKCVGYMIKNSSIQLESRHLGLIPSVEVEGLKGKIEEIARMIEETVDIGALLEISEHAVEIDASISEEPWVEERINLGVAYDKAFNFYYEDNLDLLKTLGANLIFFSPLEDRKLPEGLHGLYFGGGFPEVFAQELEKNRELRQEIKESIEGGMPAYAECGGFMYLTNAIVSIEGESHEMVGVFETATKMTGKLQRFGYVDVTIDQPSVLSNSVETAKAHEFHRSVLTNELEKEQVYQLQKTRNGEVIDHWRCGLKRHNALAAYAHIHFYCNPRLAENFMENCRVYKDGGQMK